MKRLFQILIITISLSSCKKNSSIEKITTAKIPEVELDSDSNYGSKLFANFYSNMNSKQYKDSLIARESELKYRNYDGYYIIFGENEKLRYSLEPNFENDILLSISLKFDGDEWIKNYGADLNILSNKMTNKILATYSNKYGQYSLGKYKSNKLFDDEKFDIYTWESDSLKIEFKPNDRSIIYKSYNLIQTEKLQEKEERIQSIKDKDIELEKLKSTEKNI